MRIEIVLAERAVGPDTLRQRGFHETEYQRAVADQEEEEITVLHPFNYLTEEELDSVGAL